MIKKSTLAYMMTGAMALNILGATSTFAATDCKTTVQTTVQTTVTQQCLTQEQVKTIALKQHKGIIRSVKLTKEAGLDIFVVLIHGEDGKEHHVKIDAKYGKIKKDETLVVKTLTTEQVKAIALKHHKGTVISCKLTKEAGIDAYVVHIKGDNNTEDVVKIDAKYGIVIKEEIIKSVVIMTKEEVKNIALKQYKGTVKSCELKKEAGIDIYVIGIHCEDGKELSVKVDAKSGKFCN